MPRRTHFAVCTEPTGKMAKRRRLRKSRSRKPELTPRELAAKRAASKKRYQERRKARLDSNYWPGPTDLSTQTTYAAE